MKKTITIAVVMLSLAICTAQAQAALRTDKMRTVYNPVESKDIVNEFNNRGIPMIVQDAQF